jgi:chromosome segregation ATPase
MNVNKESVMSRPGINYNDVATAAQQLADEGKNPTIEQVRLLLGTGSSTTITQHLRRWKESQTSGEYVSVKDNVPFELTAALKNVWEQLNHHADAKLQTLITRHEQTLNELQQDLQKYKANNQRWQQMFNQWSQEKAELGREKLTLAQAVESLQANHAALVTKLETQHQQLTDKQERIEELNRLHQQTQENLEHYRETTRLQRLTDEDKHEQQILQLDTSLKVMQQQLGTAQEHASVMQRLLDGSKQENVTLRDDNEQLNRRIESTESALKMIEMNYQEANRLSHHWQQQHQQASQQLPALQASLNEHVTQHALIQQQLTTTIEMLAESKDQLKILAREKWEIAEEKAQLEGQLKQMQQMVAA